MQIHSKMRDLGKANGAIKKTDMMCKMEAKERTLLTLSPWYQET